ncbi:MAG: ATP-binding cassette domain-containing protein [Oscillospiraceae bacterium]|nr:ATP-binding cassette domain-containing protein [Oscillospiraceae bacterium]
MDMIVSAQNLCKSFGQSAVLRNCSMALQKGEIYSILGVNGAGKTTLMKLLLGLQKPDRGSILVFGKNIAETDTYLSGVGSMIEFPSFYEHLDAAENLEIHLDYLQKKANISETIKKVGLSETGKKPVSQYSLGMRQRLGIARAIIHEPKLLILDEPMNGLDPVAITEMRELLRQLASDGAAILLSSHIISEVLNVSDRIGVISGGSICDEFSVQEKTLEYGENLEKYVIDLMRGKSA